MQSDLHRQVQECKELLAVALVSKEPVDQAKAELAFWTLMMNNGPQILDIVDDALTTHEEGKI